MLGGWLRSLLPVLPHRFQQQRWRQKRKRNGLLARLRSGHAGTTCNTWHLAVSDATSRGPGARDGTRAKDATPTGIVTRIVGVPWMHSVDAGLTHEQLTQLRSVLKEEGFGKQGHSRSPVENARALLHIHSHQQHGLSFDAAVKATAQAELASPRTIRHAANTFSASGTLPQPDTAHRGRGHPDHPLHSPVDPSFDMELAIHRAMLAVAEHAKHVAVKHIQQQMLEEEHMFVGEFTLRRWMHELGYAWGDKNFIGALTPQYRDARIRSFIWEYSKALRLQQSGTHLLVYLDESYIHARHQMQKGWHPTKGPRRSNETQGDADKGPRLILLHAMTRDGMLDTEDAVGSNFLHEVTPTAQFVFEAASFDDSDYHDTIDGDAFTLWMKNRVLPAFEALYPGKRMIVVMDNAGYHKPRDFDWIVPYRMGKAACTSFLEEQGLEQFTSQREDSAAVFPKRTWQLHTHNKAAPSLKELQAAVKAHLKQHPGINRTKIDKLLQPLGHFIVWTPPFVPEVQPIELIWACVKQLVAQQYTLRRTIEATRSQTDDAFDRITAAMIQKRIAHCHAWIDAFMQTEEAGSLQAFRSLAQLVAADPSTATPADIESSSMEESDITDDNENAEQ
jgi:hypothetical protein